MDLSSLADSANYDHSRQVSKISGILAAKAGYSNEDKEIIEQAALLHDIGKESIPAGILNKPGSLTPEEFEIIKTHTNAGHDQLCEAIRVLNIAAVAAREHHEKFDGSGYIGLVGNDINPFARLISVADVFDALLSRRVYKVGWSAAAVEEYFIEQACRQFDSEIVKLLIESLDEILALYGNTQ